MDIERIPRVLPMSTEALTLLSEDIEALLDGPGFASVAFLPTLVFFGLGGTLREGRRSARGL